MTRATVKLTEFQRGFLWGSAYERRRMIAGRYGKTLGSFRASLARGEIEEGVARVMRSVDTRRFLQDAERFASKPWPEALTP